MVESARSVGVIAPGDPRMREPKTESERLCEPKRNGLLLVSPDRSPPVKPTT